jgi:hypothetical protein
MFALTVMERGTQITGNLSDIDMGDKADQTSFQEQFQLQVSVHSCTTNPIDNGSTLSDV